MTKHKTLRDVIDAMTPEEHKEWITKLAKVLCVDIPEVLFLSYDLPIVKLNYETVKLKSPLVKSDTGQFTGGYYEEEYQGEDVVYVFGFTNDGLYSYKVVRNKSNE